MEDNYKIVGRNRKHIMGRTVVELHRWAAYKLGTFEYRLLGYVIHPDGKKVGCVVTDPIKGVNAKTRRVETQTGKWYKLNEPVDPKNDQNYIMDQMYTMGDWCNRNMAVPPVVATEKILQLLEVKEVKEKNDTPTETTAPKRKARANKPTKRGPKLRAGTTKKPRAKAKAKSIAKTKTPGNPGMGGA
jgi:hypothetical protein